MSDLMTNDARTDFIAGLRDLADYLEQRPDLPLSRWSSVRLATSSSEMEEIDATSPKRMLRRMTGAGKVAKQHSEDRLSFVKGFGSEDPCWGTYCIEYVLNFDRDTVCTARVVGTTEVKVWGKYTDPDRAAELKAELEALQATEVKPVVEYDCAPVLKA